MKKQSYSFPSVYEATGIDLSFVSRDLINGLQLYDQQEQSYIIGNLALNEGVSPNKLVNSSPYELDYQLLLQAGLLLANHNNNRPIAITTGFPFSTFQIYKDIARETILKLNTIEYNPGTFKNGSRLSLKTNIQQVEILPEMIGNIIGLRVGEAQATGNFFVVSLGYGTCEAVLSTENGIVHRTASSINGMQYAVDLFMRSLATKYYLGLKTEKQLDVSFRNDHIILDRQKINIVDLRRRILERYYIDIISNGLRKSFTDSDFERADKIYITGGGALFPELIEMFEKEFKQIANVEVVKNPLTLTSEGYSLNSIMLTNGDESTAVGLDIGNANTVLTQYESENVEVEIDTREKIEVKTVVEEKQDDNTTEEVATDKKKDKIIVEPEKEIITIESTNGKLEVEQQKEVETIIESIEKDEDIKVETFKKEKVVVELVEEETIIDEEPEITEVEIKTVSMEQEIKNEELIDEVVHKKQIIEEIEEREIKKVVETIKEEKLVDNYEKKLINIENQNDYEPDFS